MINTVSLEAAYAEAVTTPSDINEHLHTLRGYATRCGHITEFGVRRGVSTLALLAGLPGVYRGYDTSAAPGMLATLAAEAGVGYTHRRACVLTVDIDHTDLLFIDTLHAYHQLTAELTRHAARVRQFVILHDTTTFGTHDEGRPGPGLIPAMDEFLAGHTADGEGLSWRVVEQFDHNNGLTVLGRGAAT